MREGVDRKGNKLTLQIVHQLTVLRSQLKLKKKGQKVEDLTITECTYYRSKV